MPRNGHLLCAFDLQEEVHVAKGETIIRQGEEGDHFYLVDSGTPAAWTDRPVSSGASLIGAGFSGPGLRYTHTHTRTHKGREHQAGLAGVVLGPVKSSHGPRFQCVQPYRHA